MDTAIAALAQQWPLRSTTIARGRPSCVRTMGAQVRKRSAKGMKVRNNESHPSRCFADRERGCQIGITGDQWYSGSHSPCAAIKSSTSA